MRIEDHWLDVQVCLVSFKAHTIGEESMEEQLVIAPSSWKDSELQKRVERNFKNIAEIKELELWDYALLLK